MGASDGRHVGQWPSQEEASGSNPVDRQHPVRPRGRSSVSAGPDQRTTAAATGDTPIRDSTSAPVFGAFFPRRHQECENKNTGLKVPAPEVGTRLTVLAETPGGGEEGNTPRNAHL